MAKKYFSFFDCECTNIFEPVNLKMFGILFGLGIIIATVTVYFIGNNLNPIEMVTHWFEK